MTVCAQVVVDCAYRFRHDFPFFLPTGGGWKLVPTVLEGQQHPFYIHDRTLSRPI